MSDDIRLPEVLPLLSRGKHRNPKKGACFMELASFLAGERWSDHPACTHPLIAGLARHVNDRTSDANRQRLAELIPSVIGLTSDDPRLDALIALRCATTAMPVVTPERQRVMAVAILTSDRMLADLDGRPPHTLEARSRVALAHAPAAEQWARGFVSDTGPSRKAFRQQAAPCTVRCAVDAIAQGSSSEPDELLRELLAETIHECAARIRPHPPADRPASGRRARDPAASLSPAPR